MPDIPMPENPVEEYLSIFAGGSGNPPPPSSRIEELLALILYNHSGTIPTKVSDLDNDLDFQTESEVIAAIRSELAEIVQIEYQVVNSLPQFGELGVIYLVPNGGSGQNIKDEYLWISTISSFEKIGTTEVDLSGYVTTEAMNTALSVKVDKVTGKGLSTNDYTNAEKTKVANALTEHQDISGKVDKVTGKGLSTNDYTNEDKTKLDGIETGAQVNPGAATPNTAGLMSAADKTKLDGLSAVSLPVTVAGNPVASFTSDAAGRNLNPLLVQIDPVQADGTLVDGQVQPPSPTNIRAITGWTGANMTRTGKNLFDESQLLSASEWSVSNNEYTGAATPLYSVYSHDAGGFKNLAFKDNTRYTISYSGAKPSEGGAIAPRFMVYYTDGTRADTNYINKFEWTAYSFTTAPNKTIRSICFGYGGKGEFSIRQIQVEEGTSATAYDPFGATYAVPFPSAAGTVYGGTLDVTKGILTVTYRFLSLNGSEQWDDGGNSIYTLANQLTDRAELSTRATLFGICNMFPTRAADGVIDSAYLLATNVNSIKLMVRNLPAVAGTTLAEWKTFLSSHPLQIVYKITPVTYTLTPAQVTTLLGTNNVFADCGAVTVTYPSGTGTPVVTSGNLDAPGSAVSFEKYQDLLSRVEALEGGA